MKKRYLKLILFIGLIFSMMACNLQTLISAATPAGATPAQGGQEQNPTVEFPATFTQPSVLTTTSEPAAASPSVTVTESFTETPTNTPTPYLSPTITPLTTTPTPPPTVTKVPPTSTSKPKTPTSTEAGGTKRSGVSVEATFLSEPPTIDGDWTEWSTTTYSAHTVIFGSDKWVGPNDLESNFRVGYDSQYLYIAAEVIDDTYAQNASGSEIYKGDSLELLIDANVSGDFNSTAMSGDDYQLAITPGNGNTTGATEGYLYYPSNVRGGRGFSIESTGGSSVYYVEAAIPWSVFGVSASSGKHLGFAFSVSDNDNTSENVQESMVSNVSGRKLLNPTTWGDMTLE